MSTPLKTATHYTFVNIVPWSNATERTEVYITGYHSDSKSYSVRDLRTKQQVYISQTEIDASLLFKGINLPFIVDTETAFHLTDGHLNFITADILALQDWITENCLNLTDAKMRMVRGTSMFKAYFGTNHRPTASLFQLPKGTMGIAAYPPNLDDISNEAARIFLKLIEHLGQQQTVTLKGSFELSLTIETRHPVDTPWGSSKTYTLAHTLSLQKLPEMRFVVIDNRGQNTEALSLLHIYPISYFQSKIESLVIGVHIVEGRLTQIAKPTQKDLCHFADNWLRNIAQLGFLK